MFPDIAQNYWVVKDLDISVGAATLLGWECSSGKEHKVFESGHTHKVHHEMCWPWKFPSPQHPEPFLFLPSNQECLFFNHHHNQSMAKQVQNGIIWSCLIWTKFWQGQPIYPVFLSIPLLKQLLFQLELICSANWFFHKEILPGLCHI